MFSMDYTIMFYINHFRSVSSYAPPCNMINGSGNKLSFAISFQKVTRVKYRVMLDLMTEY